MKPLSVYLLLALVFFAACKSGNNNLKNDSLSKKTTIAQSTVVINKSSAAFKAFLAKFKILQLPLEIQTLKIVVDSTKKLTVSDNVFVKSGYPDEIYSYGLLPDTVNSYKFIWLEPTEIQIPVLATFSKSGNFIKKEYLGVGLCGSDCCYKCNEFIQIKKDLTIISVDSIKSCKCDINGPISNTTTTYLMIKNGLITSNGKITMTDVTKKMVNKNYPYQK